MIGQFRRLAHAAPVEASRRNRVVRAVLYAAAMFLFYGEVTAYIRYGRLCSPGD